MRSISQTAWHWLKFTLWNQTHLKRPTRPHNCRSWRWLPWGPLILHQHPDFLPDPDGHYPPRPQRQVSDYRWTSSFCALSASTKSSFPYAFPWPPMKIPDLPLNVSSWWRKGTTAVKCEMFQFSRLFFWDNVNVLAAISEGPRSWRSTQRWSTCLRTFRR